jgi:4-hydroxybenzoate polyprenyltransferase
MRELPRGALTLGQAKGAVIGASLLFVYAAWSLNPLCLALAPFALLWILGYSYTKRFTRWSHLWLGFGLAIAPVGGYLAVTGAWSDPWWMLPLLAMVVVTWSGGFDILYALQDAEFDRAHGLHSIPSAIGIPRAIALSRALHVVSVACLALVVLGDPLGLRALGGGNDALVVRIQTVLWAGVLFVAGMLVWEHRLVEAEDLTHLDAAFFTMNGLISIGFLLAVAVARVMAQPVLS